MNEENAYEDSEIVSSGSEILLDNEGLYSSGSDGIIEYTVVINDEQYNEIIDLVSFNSVSVGLVVGLLVGLIFFMGLKK